jgi:RNA polymerase sigma-70 factor (ECF subfamily)
MPEVPLPTPAPREERRSVPDPSDRAPSPPPFLAMADVDLMTALVRGEREALGELYDRHANVLLALSVRLVGIQAQAEELVHDVFIEAWHHARDFDSTRGSVRAWLLTRTRSRALDRRAAQARQTNLARRLYADASVVTAPTQPASFDAGRVHRGLGQLASDLVAVVELAYFDGLSASEIARALEIPIGTVKSRLARALSVLREDLAVAGKGTP